MASTLNFTSLPFAQGTSMATGTTETTILTADATYNRRLYGLAFTNSATQTPTATIRIKDGSNVTVSSFIVTTVTAVNVQTDIFNNTAASALFQHQKDANGTPYFHIPATYYITAQMSANSTTGATFYCYGETYGA